MDIMSYLLGKKAGGGAQGLRVQVVEELPATGEEDILYLVPKEGTSGDVFDEYIYIDDDFEKIGSTDIDLSGYQKTIQYDVMPTANVDTIGKIIQYIGTTNNTYTNGYFYIGMTDGETIPTYSWENIDVQDSSGGLDENAVKALINNAGTYAIDQNALLKIQNAGYSIENVTPEALYNVFGPGLYKILINFKFNNKNMMSDNLLFLSSTRKLGFTAKYTSGMLQFSLLYYAYNTWYFDDTNIYDSSTSQPGNSIMINRMVNRFLRGELLASTLDNNNISSKFTFTRLPESSITPTTANQFTNKAYVDGLVGNINTVLATLTTPTSNGGN